MDSSSETVHFTTARDCVIWAVKYLGSIMLGVYVFQSVSNQFKEHHPTITVAGVLNVLVAVACFSVFLGLLVFFFGWLGRVTISSEGVDAPKYSGLHQFIRWSEIAEVEPGSLSGWPCTVVRSRDAKVLLYLLVLGSEKSKMVDSIRRNAHADNPLVEYYSSAGA